MTPPAGPPPELPAAGRGELILTAAEGGFHLTAGHPLRKSQCIVCGQEIGGEYATAFGVAGLDGIPCDCGGVPSDMFLIHAAHLPFTRDELIAAAMLALQCPINHNSP